ncbi:MAG TPA: hypothetical protein ENG40_03570, partial [Thermoprotei archaeon]|nr:hypothetical protein [Thermoprotei archaeon]
SKAKISIERFQGKMFLTIEGKDIHSLHCMYRGSLSIGFLGENLEYGYYLTAPYDFHEIRSKWVEFRANGLLRDERVSTETEKKVYCLISCKKILKPGDEARIIGVLAWFFPNHYDDLDNYMGHIYENYFRSSGEVVKYSVENFDYLYSYTRKFHDYLYSTSIDYWLIDLIASQLTTLVKSTYYTKDELFGVWEGYGCCGHNTTDVAFYGSIMILQLFPELEKKWIKYHVKWQLSPSLSPYYEVFSLAFPENMMLLKERLKKDPSIAYNLEKFKKTIREIVEKTGKDPAGRIMHYFRGSFKYPDTYDRPDMNPEYVLMVIRDAIWLGDRDFLKSLWNNLKEAIDVVLRIHDPLELKILYHYTPAGYEALHQSIAKYFGWPRDLYGVLLGFAGAGYTFYPVSVQTFDVWSLIGITSFTGVLWLASLKAMENASKIVGDREYESFIEKMFIEARDNLIKYLWNGEYLDLWYDPISGGRDKGCAAAQLDGQMYLTLLLDLGYIFDREKVLSILKSIFKYNFKDEEGLLNGIYPGKPRPAINGEIDLPNDTGLKYTIGSQIDTPWTGIEFEVAAHMISEGMIKEAIKILERIHERYSRYGEYWNHIECGGHYYRAMDSWLVLLAIEGIHYNGISRKIRFKPKFNRRSFKGLFTITGTWGIIEQYIEPNLQQFSIKIAKGSLSLKIIELEKYCGEIERIEVFADNKVVNSSYKIVDNNILIELMNEINVKEMLWIKIYGKT